jgi:hypothetical protein
MSKRVIWSIILIVLAVTVMLVNRSVIGGLVGTFFLLAMLLMWSIPSNPSNNSRQNKGPGMKRISQAVLGIGLGLFASITAVLVLPPQLFPWVIMAVGIGLIIWIFMSARRG